MMKYTKEKSTFGHKHNLHIDFICAHQPWLFVGECLHYNSHIENNIYLMRKAYIFHEHSSYWLLSIYLQFVLSLYICVNNLCTHTMIETKCQEQLYWTRRNCKGNGSTYLHYMILYKHLFNVQQWIHWINTSTLIRECHERNLMVYHFGIVALYQHV